jgi:hypothetical protein
MRVKTSIYYFSKLEYFLKASVFFPCGWPRSRTFQSFLSNWNRKKKKNRRKKKKKLKEGKIVNICSEKNCSSCRNTKRYNWRFGKDCERVKLQQTMREQTKFLKCCLFYFKNCAIHHNNFFLSYRINGKRWDVRQFFVRQFKWI